MLQLQDNGSKMPSVAGRDSVADTSQPPEAEEPHRPSGLRLSQILASLSEGVVVISERPSEKNSKNQPDAVLPAEVAVDVLHVTEQLDTDRDGRPGPAPEVLLYPPGKSLRRARTNLTVGQIIDRTRHAGFGVFIALLALLAMPVPGLSVIMGFAVAGGGLQMMLGFDRPWLPRWVRRHRVSIATLRWLSVGLAKWTSGMERFIRPRFETLTKGPFWSLCGLGVLLQGLGLALPLPIPFSNVIFVLPVILFAIALLERDGLLMMIAFTVTAIEVALAILFSKEVIQAIQKAIEWFS